MRLLSALTLAAGLAALPPASACDHAKAAAAGGPDCAARCPHAAAATTAKATSADDAILPAVRRESAPAATLKTGADCPYAAKRAGAGGHADCPYSKAAMKAGMAADAVPAAAAAGAAAPAGAGQDLRATGKVVCARCELHQSGSCRSVFQPADTKTTYPLCDQEMTEQMLKLTRHGELELTVHGRISRNGSGEEVLCVDGFSVGTI